jgi:hypothetical protein
MVPATALPAAVTETLVSLPRVAVTVTPWPGLAFAVPLAGLMLSSDAAAELADELAPASW